MEITVFLYKRRGLAGYALKITAEVTGGTMAGIRGTAADTHEIAKWDPAFTRQVANAIGPLVKRWFRAEVRNLDNIPPAGGALLVSNHSGGMFTPDVVIFEPAFYDRFGYHRPLYTLAHYGVFMVTGPLKVWLRRLGVIEASRETASAALHSDAAVLVFPGGDYDSYRSTWDGDTVDFNGRTGYVGTAIEAGVPIVPMVSIGAQETQLFLTRGNWVARRLGLPKARMNILPLSFGFPFGFSMIFPPNLPLPAKVVTEVLEPIDVTTRFGADPDVHEVDAHVRSVMQAALKRLAGQRRLPILG
jgi:1-acyl-sn-glycerol-3-phosphate acyltransferase